MDKVNPYLESLEITNTVNRITNLSNMVKVSESLFMSALKEPKHTVKIAQFRALNLKRKMELIVAKNKLVNLSKDIQ